MVTFTKLVPNKFVKPSSRATEIKLMGSGSGLFWKIKKDERKYLMQSLIPVGRGRSLPSVSPHRTHPNAFLKAMGFALMKIGLFYIPTSKATGSRSVILIQKSRRMLNKHKMHLSASQQNHYASPNPTAFIRAGCGFWRCHFEKLLLLGWLCLL